MNVIKWDDSKNRYSMRWFKPMCLKSENMDLINSVIKDINNIGVNDTIYKYIPKKYNDWLKYGICDYDTKDKHTIFSITRYEKKLNW